jgi:hypothetical protein
MARHAHHCPCSCHRGAGAPCDPEHPAGCGLAHAEAAARDARGCPGCARPTADAALCAACTTSLLADLALIPGLAAELEITRTKQDHIGDPSTRGSQNIPLGYRPMALEIADVLHITLTTWAREVAAAAGSSPLDVPARHPATLAVWLAEHAEHARHLAEAGHLAEEVGYAVRQARRAIDRPPDRAYVGPCDDCTADLYAHPRAEHTACQGCGAVYPVAARREWLLAALREHLATAGEIALGVGDLYGQPVTRKLINLWHHRKHLPERGSTRDGWPLFRIGDVLDLAANGGRAMLTGARPE